MMGEGLVVKVVRVVVATAVGEVAMEEEEDEVKLAKGSIGTWPK